MKELEPNESQLIGKWIFDGSEVTGDEACQRIEWLIANVLQEVAFSREYGSWETLYRNPKDGTFWERTYPESELQGGGPPQLRKIPPKDAHMRYDFTE